VIGAQKATQGGPRRRGRCPTSGGRNVDWSENPGNGGAPGTTARRTNSLWDYRRNLADPGGPRATFPEVSAHDAKGSPGKDAYSYGS